MMMRKAGYLFFVLSLFITLSAHAVDEGKAVAIAQMENFSGLNREDILTKRKNAVQMSGFLDTAEYYDPDSSVFQIESGLPWISAHEITCYGHGTQGPSRESFGILNPLVLYYPLMAAYNFSKSGGCSEVDYLLVNKLFYNAEKKVITAHIDYTSFYRKNPTFYRIHLSDTNARDLGYRYAHASYFKNIKFAETVNLSNSTPPTRGFYHRGGSCGVPGGCNNYSPRQTELEFYLTDLPAEIDIKLWKVYPLYDSDEGDITYKLMFD